MIVLNRDTKILKVQCHLSAKSNQFVCSVHPAAEFLTCLSKRTPSSAWQSHFHSFSR